jgi:hypothetical protein
MNFNLFKSESNLAFPRCEHRSPSGRQCSQPVCTTDPRFCGTHKPTPQQLASAELAQAAGTLSSREDVYRLLTAVTLNRISGRISPKEASVYAYLGQQLLRGLREIDHFQQLQSEREERNRIPEDFGWSLPRPDRSDPPAPAQTESVNSSAQIPQNSPSNSTPATSSTSAPVAAASSPESLTSSTSFSSSTSNPPAAAPPSKSSTSSTTLSSKIPPPPFDPRHFYPLDPTLPRGAQDHSRNIPPPDEAECRRLAARRGLDFNRPRTQFPGAHR